MLAFVTCAVVRADDDDYVIDEEAEERFRAQALHDKALDLAISGNEQDALTDFEAAAALDPTNFGFWSDLGVTQMRIGLLDEALNSFLTADELEPGSKLVRDNLNALQQHIDFREKQQNQVRISVDVSNSEVERS